MKEKIISLSKGYKNNHFLKNEFEIRCKCSYSEKITYYDFLIGGKFEIGKPIHTISPFISEGIYEETISVTPLNVSEKCPVCGERITAMFPLSLENLISILQSKPPDPQMYG